MKKCHRISFNAIKKTIIVMFIVTSGLLFCWSDISVAASDRDKRIKKTAPSKIQRSGETAPSPTAAPPQNLMQKKAAETMPVVIIDYFKRAIEVAPGTMSMTHPMGGSAPDSATIQPGESITLKWGVKGCNLEQVLVRINNEHIPSSEIQQHTTSDGCTYYKGQRTFTPWYTTRYTIDAQGSPVSVTASKDFTVNVPRPALDITPPEVDDDTLNVTLFLRNSGDADLDSTTINVNYIVSGVGGSGARIMSGSFTTSPLSINHGRRVQLGSFSLDSHRDQLFEYESVEILIGVGISNGLTLEDQETFSHTWRSKTYTIDNTLLTLLSSMSSYDIRLNNYGGGVHPHVPDDCHITLNLMGTEVPRNFSLDPYVEELLIAIPPSPIPIKQKVALYLNNIVSSKVGASDLFFISSGKLGIHFDFPNSGSREIKTGFHNWGSDNEFRDNPVADVELGSFSIDVLLTPELRDGKVSYGRVEVQTHNLSASVVGAMDDTLNKSGAVRRFLNNTLNDIIVSYLTSVVDNNSMRTAFEDGITNNLPADITKILSLSGRGSTITLSYL